MSHVFISYSKEDVKYVRQLVKTLLEHGFNVWIDDRSLRSSEDWWQSIVLSIRECSAMIIVLTPASDESSWVQREITLALKYNKAIYPLWLSGSVDTPNWELFVRTQYHDVRGGKLPAEKFFESLSQHVESSGGMGKDVTTTVHVPPVDVNHDAIYRNAIQNPPDVSFEVDDSPGKQAFIIAFAVVIILAIALLLLSSFSQPDPDITATPETTVSDSDTTVTEIVDETSVLAPALDTQITDENFLDVLNAWRSMQNPPFDTLTEDDILHSLADEQVSYLYGIAPDELPTIRDTQFQGDADIADVSTDRGYSGIVEIFVEIKPDEDGLTLEDVIFILEQRGPDNVHALVSELGYSLSVNPITNLKYFVIISGSPED